MPGDCTTLCIVDEHDNGTFALPQQLNQSLGLIVVMSGLILVLPLVRRISSAAVGYIARPPDIILLYGHFRI
jgi:hypothetical protein